MKRRTFLRNTSGIVVLALAPTRIILPCTNSNPTFGDKLSAKAFLNPPDDARPWVYWFWINGNITKEGITADLEAMQRVGIGGVLIMEVAGSPQGPVAFGSDNWKEMFRFACLEANRLGLVINMNNGAGWTGSGGPWNTPENSMQHIFYKEITVEGGKTFNQELPEPGEKEAKRVAYSVLKNKDGTLKYYRDIAVIAFPTPQNNTYKNEDIKLKAGFTTGSTPPSMEPGDVGRFKVFPIEVNPVPEDAVIKQDKILDITRNFSNGHLSWDVPPGNWTIVRFGHGTTGKTNHPAPLAGMGLECDKMNKEAVEIHFNEFIGEMLELAGPLAGKTFIGTHVDSWEVGGQTWTNAFPEEFKKRCGYDIIPFLPAMTGRIIGSAEITERFLWDLRFTISELIAENYAGHLRKLANQHGIEFSMEALDNTPFDEIRVAGQANLPQTEFWYRRERNAVGQTGDNYEGVFRSYAWTSAMVSSAHVYGKQIVPSEAFTAVLGENWLAHPALLKPQGDWAFCSGINRFIFHRYAMQPWLNRKPGMAMGFWGIHYERTQTWWEETKPWHEYLARCQYLLQKGLFVADLLYMQAEAVPNRFIPPGIDFSDPNPPDPPGYNFDGCTADVVFNRISIKEGMILLPDGMSYRIMVLPSPGEQVMAGIMTVKLAKKIEELVNHGMVVVGPPPVRTPGLSNYPDSEDELKQIVDRLWGNTKSPGDRKVGKGRVIWGVSPQSILQDMGIQPDFSCGSSAPFRYIHRRAEDGSEIYFVSNKQDETVEVMCNFRVKGRQPELWWPETGQIEKPSMYSQDNNLTSLPLQLSAFESVFVIFRPDTLPERNRIIKVLHNNSLVSKNIGSKIHINNEGGNLECLIYQSGEYTLITAEGKERKTRLVELPDSLEITGSWEVNFTPGWGAPENTQFPELISWSDHSDEGIHHFSGKANYCKKIMIPASMLKENQLLFLNLGKVEVIARVKLNGKDLGILWKKPFLVEISSAAIEGENFLEIEVVNLWPNRLIGDAKLPEDCNWSSPGVPATLVEYPMWLKVDNPSLTGRFTFSTIKVWSKDDALIKSGLLGPVILKPVVKIELKKVN